MHIHTRRFSFSKKLLLLIWEAVGLQNLRKLVFWKGRRRSVSRAPELGVYAASYTPRNEETQFVSISDPKIYGGGGGRRGETGENPGETFLWGW